MGSQDNSVVLEKFFLALAKKIFFKDSLQCRELQWKVVTIHTFLFWVKAPQALLPTFSFFFHSLPDNRFHSIKKILTNDPLICSERLYAFVLSTSTRQNNEIFIAPSNILLPNDVAM